MHGSPLHQNVADGEKHLDCTFTFEVFGMTVTVREELAQNAEAVGIAVARAG